MKTMRLSESDFEKLSRKNKKTEKLPFVVENQKAKGMQRENKMNKTESAYFKHLETQKHIGNIQWFEYEPLGLRLADKTFYHPDFMIMNADSIIEIHEVKGFMRDDANVKLKAAACKFPFLFKLVKKEKDAWNIRTI